MFILHECDGNFFPLGDHDAIVARVEAANQEAWLGEAGQVGLEYRGPQGEDFIFFSLVGEGRYLVFSQRRNGEKIFAVDLDASPKLERSFSLGGRERRIADSDLVSSAMAASAASCFLQMRGLLTPVVHWRKDGKPHWPEFE